MMSKKFGMSEKFRKFRVHLAEIQVKLASLQFNHISSLYQDPGSQEFSIGQDCQTGRGPWSSAIEYFNHRSDQALEIARASTYQGVCEDDSFTLPDLLKQLMGVYTNKTVGERPFGLAHTNLGAHNILMNKKFEICALIDFDGLMAVPIEVQAQFPCFIGLDPESPYQVETNPLASRQMEVVPARFAEYIKLIQEQEERIGRDLDLPVRLGEVMMSNAALIFKGLQDYKMHLLFLNQQWMDFYSQLSEYSLSGATKESDKNPKKPDGF